MFAVSIIWSVYNVHVFPIQINVSSWYENKILSIDNVLCDCVARSPADRKLKKAYKWCLSCSALQQSFKIFRSDGSVLSQMMLHCSKAVSILRQNNIILRQKKYCFWKPYFLRGGGVSNIFQMIFSTFSCMGKFFVSNKEKRLSTKRH